MGVQSLDWEDSLKEGMATHSSILAWRISWTEEPGGLQSIGSQSQPQLKRLTHTHTHAHAQSGTEHCCFKVLQEQLPFISQLPPRRWVTLAHRAKESSREGKSEMPTGAQWAEPPALLGSTAGGWGRSPPGSIPYPSGSLPQWGFLSKGLQDLKCRVPRFNAWDSVLRAGALGWPWRIGWEGRWKGVQDGEHMYTRDWFMSMYGKTTTVL